jgi:hypothetical protein
MNRFLFFILLILCQISFGQEINKFEQISNLLPTPNAYRNASGAPGHAYWQQQADYKMKIRIDDQTQRIYGEETIVYHNFSPDVLSYLWLQLDQNRRAKDSDTYKISTNSFVDSVSMDQLNRLKNDFDGGFKIEDVQDVNGKDIPYTINKTMMRIDIPQDLMPGSTTTFSIKWWYNVNNRMEIGGRSGYEYFEEDDNYLYTIAQYFPRMCVYSDDDGWQNKQFLGRGEFTLTFGNYDVEITVPEDHLVAATGTLQNPDKVLTKEQKKRLEKAKQSFEQPVLIATEQEAREKERTKATKEKTWHFKAENVRDFAFASSRKFIWDAMAVQQNNNTIMAMSMYPKEGNPLWEQYSTKAVAHTLKWYSHYTFDYPYPVAWSIHTNRIGMEYPMICFNGGRPEKDGTYSERTKYGLISVIIHEVGHNYFPMIVNSDERQWTWMDEGLTTFIQYLTEQEWEREYPSRRGAAFKIVDYMGGDKSKISPIMSSSENIWQFGNNAYAKPATALNILRETVMGRELFDYAFKEYANRWMFKHPEPADLFRTLEDASGVDLDWFWNGWFFTNDHVDISLKEVKWKKPDTKNPDAQLTYDEAYIEENPHGISSIKNREEIKQTYNEKDPTINDFYNKLDRKAVKKEEYEEFVEHLETDQKETIEKDHHFYELTFENKGGLVMPVIFQFVFTDGTTEDIRIPAEIWRQNNNEVTKVFETEKEVDKIILDPYLETADTDRSNNYFPEEKTLNRFDLFKQRNFQSPPNPMQKAKKGKT